MDEAPENLDRAVSAANPRQRRFRMVPVRYLLPNLITLLALCSGVTAIRLGLEGKPDRGDAAAQRQQGDHVGQQVAHGHHAESALALG